MIKELPMIDLPETSLWRAEWTPVPIKAQPHRPGCLCPLCAITTRRDENPRSIE